jgi:hypothetical protein
VSGPEHPDTATRSTISPNCTVPPGLTPRPNHSTSARSPSLAPSTRTPRPPSPISPSYTTRLGPTPRPSRSTSARSRSARR